MQLPQLPSCAYGISSDICSAYPQAKPPTASIAYTFCLGEGFPAHFNEAPRRAIAVDRGFPN